MLPHRSNQIAGSAISSAPIEHEPIDIAIICDENEALNNCNGQWSGEMTRNHGFLMEDISVDIVATDTTKEKYESISLKQAAAKDTSASISPTSSARGKENEDIMAVLLQNKKQLVRRNTNKAVIRSRTTSGNDSDFRDALKLVMSELKKTEFEIKAMYERRHETGDIRFFIDSKEIPAHRDVLAAISPKYKAQFFGPMAEVDHIYVENVSPAAFEEFLQFFYVNHFDLTIETIADVFDLANQSMSDEIIAECVHFIINNLNENPLWIYQSALLYKNDALKNFSENFIIENFETVFRTEEFLTCDRDMFCQVLDLELMCSEINIFEFCVSWAKEYCKQNSIDLRKFANLRAALGNAISKIRFCSMTIEQIIGIETEYPGFLLHQEMVKIIQTIEKQKGQEATMTSGARDWHPIRDIIDERCINGKASICNHSNFLNGLK